MAKLEREFFDVGDVPWRPVDSVTGLYKKVLSTDSATGSFTGMTRFEAGTDTSSMGVQRHEYWEEVLIVSGSLYDLSLGRTFVEGMYACRPPGMPHGPWRSEGGCVTFEVCTFERS